MKFEEFKLSELVQIIGGGTPKRKVESYWNGDIPWLSVKDFNDKKRWVHQTDETITEKGLEESSTKLLKTGDLIISARGTVGEITQLAKPMAFNQSCYGLRANELLTTNDYIYYWIRYNVNYVKNNTHGSVFDTITRNTFDNLIVKLPPKEYQDKVVNMLTMLDRKIELNNLIVVNLEKLAQTLFKRWFVDFEFPNEEGKPYKSSGGKMVESELGMIPEGWNVKSLSEIAKFQNGLAMQRYRPQEEEGFLPVLKIKELRQGFTDFNSDECSINIKDSVKVYDGDVIFSWSASLLVKLWVGGDAGLNQHLFKVTSEEHSKWFYYFWTKHYLDIFNAIAQDKATTMGHIKRSHLDESKAIVPSKKFYNYFDSVFNQIVDQKIKLSKENVSLTNIRDTLLPKLLSGEIELPDEMEVTNDVSIS